MVMSVHFIELIIVMAFSSFFSGMEIAFVSSDKLRFEMEKNNMSFSAHILSNFYKNPNTFISTMLVGNNIALVIYGIIMADIINRYLLFGIDNEFLQLVIQTIVSTLIILFTGEFIPKSIFKINPNLSLRLFSFPLFVCYVVLYPISKITSGISALILRLFGINMSKEDSDKAFSKVDLDYFVRSSIENAATPEKLGSEVEIFRNALDFSEIKVRDCYVPRTEIVAVDIHDDISKLKSLFIESGISKIIVYDGNIDNIIGYIHSSEMFHQSSSWTDSIQAIPIVPETMPVHKLMKMFMQQKKSIGVVVDEFGGTSGIVTLEDIVEEIFGDIEDEHDNSKIICKQINDKEFVMSGRMEIEKINETFGLSLPESDEYITVGGLLLEKCQGFPKVNEEIRVGSYSFKVVKKSATKIEMVRLKIE